MPRLIRHRELVLAMIIAALVAAVAVRAPVFLSAGSLDTIATDGAILAIMALAQMLALVIRGIDLSVAANMALTGMIVAMLSRAHPAMPVAGILAAAIGVGLVLGALNAALIAWLGMPAIVVTLGTMSIYRGLVFLINDGGWVNAHELGGSFVGFPDDRLWGIAHVVWIALVVIAIQYAFLRHVRTGRELYALGGNPTAAQYVGIDGGRLQLVVYAAAGALSGLSGYLWVARYAVAYTETAQGFEMQTIAACVIGGVSTAGGRGTVVGCLLGAAFLVILFNALPVIDVSPFAHTAISGAVILVAVVVNARAERRRGKRILARSSAGAARPA